jgi:predicted ester cyclase
VTGEEVRAFYYRYNDCCNRHDFEAVNEFVHNRVQVNGQTIDIDEYRKRLFHVTDSMPDYRWQIEHLLVEDDWVAVHFTDTGTYQGNFLLIPSAGTRIRTIEFDFYRVDEGKIAEVWGGADNLGILRQLLGNNEGKG